MPENDAQTPATNPHAALRAEVATAIAAASPKVRDMVIGSLTDAEINRRAAAVTSIVTKLDEKTKELQKSEKQGTQSFNAQGEKVGDPTFTNEQAQSMKKLREEIGKLQNALTKAFEEGDFSKVLELGK